MNVKTLSPAQALRLAFRKTRVSLASIGKEAEIDVLVYKLYGLSYGEVLVVDGGFGLSERAYDKIEVV
ncbi:MAG: hypothetical protein AB8H12_12410 [Lewinella sp.]